MRIWLDVESSPRVKTGPGPVVNLISFSSRSRLNQAGDWTATVPALDERGLQGAGLRRPAAACRPGRAVPKLRAHASAHRVRQLVPQDEPVEITHRRAHR